MRYYATLCDYAYLPRALVLYESLVKHSSEAFRLNVLPLDSKTEDILTEMELPSLCVLGYCAFENDQRLRGLAESRTRQEYAWTCASQLCEWLLFCEDCSYLELTYLDADMMFFSDPKQVFDEIGERSIGIIPHRFIPEKQYLAVNGQFNVSWVSFKNTPAGRDCLSTWARQVRERCSATEGCGDQKYLDEWPSKYGDEVCVIQNPGAGLAPWNMNQYSITDGPCVDGRSVVFYHYHEFRMYENGESYTSGYPLRTSDVRKIYDPYIDAYKRAKETIESLRIQSR